MSLARFAVDPFLSGSGRNGTGGFFEDLGLVFVLFFRIDSRPTALTHDFSCTLPLTFYSLNENTTVSIGECIAAGWLLNHSCIPQYANTI